MIVGAVIFAVGCIFGAALVMTGERMGNERYDREKQG